MSRFNSPEEVQAWADGVAVADYARYKEHNCDLNPYCTVGRRDDWRRGFKGLGPRSYEADIGVGYDLAYQRGAAAARLIAEHGDTYEVDYERTT